MKTIELMSKVTICIFTSLKEALYNVIDMNGNVTAKELAEMTVDGSIYIEYKDGTSIWMSEGEVIGIKKLKRTGIKFIYMEDASCMYVYGNHKIINREDMDEEYSPEVDHPEKDWIIEGA